MPICDCGKYYKNSEYDQCYDCLQSQREDENRFVKIYFSKVIRDSEKAILIQQCPDLLAERCWIPKSQIDDVDED